MGSRTIEGANTAKVNRYCGRLKGTASRIASGAIRYRRGGKDISITAINIAVNATLKQK